MKKMKIFGALLFTMLLMTVFNCKVNAATLTKGEIKYQYYDSNVAKTYHIYDKKIGTSPVYCLDGISVPAGDTGDTCNIIGTDTGLGYVLANGSDYTQTEINIIYYYTNQTGPTYTGDLTPNTSLVTTARNNKATYDAIKGSTFNISLSSETLNFHRDDTFFVSDPIVGSGLNYVNGTVAITASGVAGATIEGNYSSFRVKVPVANVTSTSTITVNISATQQKYYDASIYQCGDTNNQRLVLLTSTPQRTASKSITGTIKPVLRIKKVDERGFSVIGATLKLCKDAHCDDEVFTWRTAVHELSDLEDGTYYLYELETPKGYNPLSGPITIVLNNGMFEHNTTTYEVLNTLTETVISKKNAVNGEELPGATLEILDENKEKMSCTVIDKDGNKKELEECSWISTDKPTKVVGLPKGKYFLKETISPDGYEINKNMVSFEVKANGDVTEVEMVNELEVEVPDTLSARSALLLTIAMIDIALGIGIITYVKKNKLEQ